jgi:hypothetical protein
MSWKPVRGDENLWYKKTPTFDWLAPPIDDWWDPTAGLPVDPDVGDRYGSDATANGWTIDYIYEWTGEEWVETAPEEGWMMWELFDMILWFFFSGGWGEVGSGSYWTVDTAQTGLTGDKTGQFNLNIGTGTLGSGTHTIGGSTGVTLSGALGILTLAGIGNTKNENLILDFETTANTVGISSTTGVSNLFFTSADTVTRVNIINTNATPVAQLGLVRNLVSPTDIYGDILFSCESGGALYIYRIGGTTDTILLASGQNWSFNGATANAILNGTDVTVGTLNSIRPLLDLEAWNSGTGNVVSDGAGTSIKFRVRGTAGGTTTTGEIDSWVTDISEFLGAISFKTVNGAVNTLVERLRFDSTGGLLTIPTATYVGLKIKGASSQSGSLLNCTNSSDVSLMSVASDGSILTSGTLGAGATTVSGLTIGTLTGVLRGDTGVVSVDSDVTDLVSAASTTVAGKVELTITSEVDAGTSTTLAVTPDSLAGSIIGQKAMQTICFDFTTDVATGDGKGYFVVPACLNGMNLIRAQAVVITAGTTNATTIAIYNVTDSVDMLSGNISIASGGTVGTVGTINTSYDDVATNDVLRADVDAVSTTAPKGLIIVLEFGLP